MSLSAIFLNIFLQRWHVGGDTKKNAARIVEVDADIFERTGAMPMVAGEV